MEFLQISKEFKHFFEAKFSFMTDTSAKAHLFKECNQLRKRVLKLLSEVQATDRDTNALISVRKYVITYYTTTSNIDNIISLLNVFVQILFGSDISRQRYSTAEYISTYYKLCHIYLVY